jgi:hypothetical protein
MLIPPVVTKDAPKEGMLFTLAQLDLRRPDACHRLDRRPHIGQRKSAACDDLVIAQRV